MRRRRVRYRPVATWQRTVKITTALLLTLEALSGFVVASMLVRCT